jgi:DNA-binding response OmpR family regulator
MNILIIEDEQKIAASIKNGLEGEGYQVDISATGEDGFYLLNTKQYDLLILDLMLPGRNGLDILKALRQKGIKVPVIILTARDAVEDRVEGLDKGADDYLVKPFAMAELSARIRALLRRSASELPLRLKLADLELDRVLRKVKRGGKELGLTNREFDLLEYLLRHQNSIVTREMLAKDVWQQTMRATPLDNVIDVHIARLRAKIDEPFDKKLLHTIRGVGFMLSEEAP